MCDDDDDGRDDIPEVFECGAMAEKVGFLAQWPLICHEERTVVIIPSCGPHTHPYPHTHTHRCINIHTHTHTHVYTHARKHTHIYTVYSPNEKSFNHLSASEIPR